MNTPKFVMWEIISKCPSWPSKNVSDVLSASSFGFIADVKLTWTLSNYVSGRGTPIQVSPAFVSKNLFSFPYPLLLLSVPSHTIPSTAPPCWEELEE